MPVQMYVCGVSWVLHGTWARRLCEYVPWRPTRSPYFILFRPRQLEIYTIREFGVNNAAKTEYSCDIRFLYSPRPRSPFLCLFFLSACSCRNQQMHSCEDVQLCSFFFFAGIGSGHVNFSLPV